MSTRSAVGTYIDGKFKGRYIHSDGYPTWMAAMLARLIRRDGLATVLATLSSRIAWSSLDPDTDHPEWAYGGMDLVPGYGIAHRLDRDPNTSLDDWVELPDGDSWGTAWAYGFGGGLLHIFRIVPGDLLAPVEAVPLSELAVDRKAWQRIEDAGDALWMRAHEATRATS